MVAHLLKALLCCAREKFEPTNRKIDLRITELKGIWKTANYSLSHLVAHKLTRLHDTRDVVALR